MAKDYLNEPDVAPPSKSYLNEPDLPQAGAPTPSVVAPLAPANPYAGTGGTASPPIEDPTQAPPVASEPNTYVQDAITAFTPPGALAMAEKYAIDPTLKAAQKHVGKPLLDATIDYQKVTGSPITKIPGYEHLARNYGSLIAGSEQSDQFGGTAQGLKSINELKDALAGLPDAPESVRNFLGAQKGDISAATVEAASKMFGDAPLFLIKGPQSGVAILDHAAAGTLFGLADPEMTVNEGAVMGGAMGGAGAGVSKAAKLMKSGGKKVIGVLDRAFTDFFADAGSKLKLEFGQPVQTPVPTYSGSAHGQPLEGLKLGPIGEERLATNAANVDTLNSKSLTIDKSWQKKATALQTMEAVVSNPGSVKLVMGKVKDLGESINPQYVALTFDETGALVARADESQKGMVLKRVEIPLRNTGDAMRLKGLMDRELEGVHFYVPPEVDEKLTPEMSRALKRTGGDLDTPSAQVENTRQSYFLTTNGDRLELHDIDSTQGKILHLTQREGGGLVALDTPEGTKYGRAMTDEGDQGVGVAPFEPHEGIPTFSGIHQPNTLRGRDSKSSKMITDEELAKVLEKPVETAGAPPPPPDVPEDMPPAPPPGPPPPPEQPIADRIQKMSAKLPFWTRVGRQLVGAHLRAPTDLAGYISDQQSVKNLAAGWAATNAALEKRAGEGATQAFRGDTLKLFKGDMTFDQFTAKAETNPATKEAWGKIREMVGTIVKTRDSNQAWLAQRGYVPDETWAQSEGDAVTSYATREYMAHFLKPGQWLKIVQNDEKTMRAAVTGYQAWAEKAGKTLDEDSALAKIVESLGTEDPGSILFQDRPTSGSGSPTGKLNFRKDLPQWYRDLLGENRDGFLAMSRTLAAQDALIANFKVYEGVAANPAWASDKKLGPTWTKFPENKRLYGAMSNKWAPQNVYDALYTIPNIKNEVNKLIAIPLGIVKTNQVSLGSFRTFLNMTMDNLMGGVLSGGLDMTKPSEFGKAIKYAAKSMSEVSSLPLIGKANPLGTNEFAKFIRDARRIGVDAPGHIGSTLSSEQSRLVKQAYSEIAGVKTDEGSGLISKFYELHQRLGAKGSMVVDGIDRVQKLASWKILTDKFIEDGLGSEDAMRKAARRIFMSYPMYDRVGLMADKMRTSGLGVVSPYSTFAMERNRIYGQLVPRLIDSVSNGASEDPGLHFRLLKYAALGAALFGANGVMRRGFGNVSDAEVDLAMQRRSGSGSDKFSPNVAQWVAPFHDGRGKVAVVDGTQWLGPLSYLQGDPRLAPIANIAINVIKQPLSGGLLGMGVDSAMKAMGVNSGAQAAPAPQSGLGAKAAYAGDAVLQNGGAPNSLMDLYNNVKKTGALGDTGSGRDTLTGTQAALRTFPGIPFEQGVTQAGKQQQFSKGVHDARAILFKAATMKPDHAAPVLQKVYEEMNKLAGGDPEAKRLRNEAGSRIKEISQEISKTSKAERTAKAGK